MPATARVDVDDTQFETPPDTLAPEMRELILGAYKLPSGLLMSLDVARATAQAAILSNKKRTMMSPTADRDEEVVKLERLTAVGVNVSSPNKKVEKPGVSPSA